MPLSVDLPAAIPVAGVELATVASGLKSNGTDDMVLARVVEGSTCAAVFTQNAFCAAPVTLCREHMFACDGAVRALLVNSGNANAGTGLPGLEMARGHCEAVASTLDVPVASVLPFSTGVIGQLLPDAVMRKGIAQAGDVLNGGEADHSGSISSVQAWQAAARGIMTTDTQVKVTSQQVDLGGQTITITGMAKGAGMIQPDMATMLSYIFTDATVSQGDLSQALTQAVAVSFNAITVDSDTSTNDACVLIATGAHSAAGAVSRDKHWSAFMDALVRVFKDLAESIVRDAEGATKFIRVHVSEGLDVMECRQVAYAIANSPLVKTAMFASDANVGRLLMAIGKADVPELDASKVKVSLGDVLAFEAGGIATGYTEAQGAAVMAREDIKVSVELGRGKASASVCTSDLSHEYVSVNADYRS